MAFAGAAIGLCVALLFVGAINETASAVGRVIFLALVFGFSTPYVLESVERKVERSLLKIESRDL